MLRKWKQTAEERSFRDILAPNAARNRREPAAPDSAESKLIEKLGLPAQDDLESVTVRLIAAAMADLNAFKGTPGWPRHAITLNLRMTTGGSIRAFHASALADAIQTFTEIVVIAPPGTGKTTTLLQVAEAILSQGSAVAAFVPLGEWSSQSDTLLQSVVRRRAFGGEREEHLKLLAYSGRLVLLVDGWNELDAASRKRAAGEIKLLQRDFPQLGIVLSTRRQVSDVPISGPVVEIDTLAEGQQMEIARALRGSQGEVILDHAWRTAGVRELVAIPLYLTALLARIPGDTLPTTKEEVLRLFIGEHERAADKGEALRTAIFGFHREMLTALAVEATYAANTTISNRRACAALKQVEDRLSAEGQITSPPQPTTILDALVGHHLLVRSGAEPGGGISFQHQQFQEWYASFEVEQLMRAAAGDPVVGKKLNADVLNLRAWEEPILFACERVSRSDQTGLQAVAAAALESMAIDPMLAAEMIYRSSSEVWDAIKEKIIALVGKWHVRGKVDRAAHFMITTGRPEFAPQVWPLISNADSQVHLVALRAGRRFRPSVLGADADAQLARLPEELRESVVSGIASSSGMDGIALATRIAKSDASPKVKFSVIESLQFRRADRFVAEVLSTAPDEVWNLLARKGYVGEIADPNAAARLVRERQHYIETETNIMTKLDVLLNTGPSGMTLGREVAELIEDADFPAKDQHAGWIIHRASKLYPDELTSALLHRLEAGREIPFRTENLLQAAGITVDEGPVVDVVLQPASSPKVAEAAVCIVGPKTVGRLIDMLIAIDAEVRALKRANAAKHEEHRRLSAWICRTNVTAFIEALLSRSSTVVPGEISLLADLFARRGKDYDQPAPPLDEEPREQMIAAVDRWAESLLASPEATTDQFAKLVGAIERLAAPQLLPALERLLAEDLSRWRRKQGQHVARGRRRHLESYLMHSWFHYRRAFAVIDDCRVVEAMKRYLPDFDFGFAAACVLREKWDREQSSPKDRSLMSSPDFSDVRSRRMERRNKGFGGDSSPFAEAIIAVINDLIKPGSGDDDHGHALQLAVVGFSIPYGGTTATINALLHLPQPLRFKQALLAVLAAAGEIIQAEMVLDGVKALAEEAKSRQWYFTDQNWWEWEGWLELLPFSDRPSATLDALDLIEPIRRHPSQLRRLLSALGYAPADEAEEVLALLQRRDATFFNEHDWLAALEKRGTASSARLLLDLICEDAEAQPGGRDAWTLSRRLAGGMFAHPDVRAEVYCRCEHVPTGLGKGILEHAIAEVADAEGILALVRSYAAQGRPFDRIVHSAIEHVALGERPSVNWAGAKEVVSVPLTGLRKRLFAIVKDDTEEAGLAAACLTAIDKLRDDYGPAESEPRHPDIDSGRPWPLSVF